MGDKGLAMGVCLLLMLAWGVLLSVMVPPWQTPDEYTHLQMIGNSLGNDGMADHLFQDMDMELEQWRIRYQYEEKVNIKVWKAALTKAPDYARADCLPGGVSVSVVKHLPAAVGILLGIVLYLPSFWVLELGELFSLLFYVGCCTLALRLMPTNKEILLVLMAFPMTLQQAASLSYDSVLLPLCFLFIAYIFHMRCRKERLGWGDVLCTLLLLFLIVYIKLPYVFLGLLVFLLPVEKLHLKLFGAEIDGELIKKWKIPAGILLAVLAALGIYVMRGNFWVQLVGVMLLEWKRTLYLFAITAYTWGKYLMISSVGQFGWLEAAVPFWFALVSYILLALFAVWGEEEESDYGLKRKTRLYIWIVFLILCSFTVTSMVNHTIKVTLFGSEYAAASYNIREALYQIPYIGGLQGRYFLPFLALPFAALPRRWGQGKGKTWLAALYMVTGIIVTALVLYRRYWVG